MIRLYGDLSPSIRIDIKHALQWLMIRLYDDLSPSIHIDIKHALQWLMSRLYGDLSPSIRHRHQTCTPVAYDQIV